MLWNTATQNEIIMYIKVSKTLYLNDKSEMLNYWATQVSETFQLQNKGL